MKQKYVYLGETFMADSASIQLVIWVRQLVAIYRQFPEIENSRHQMPIGA